MTAIAINLLPHRAIRREQRRRAFISLCIFTIVLGLAIVLLVGGVFQAAISLQNSRNEFIAAENRKLDEQIKQVASLQQEIDALRARQQAVEDLQSDRNQPVHLLDELVKLTPEGIYLRSVKQEGLKVVIAGVAQSNERVSEFLRNLSDKSAWIEKPNLIEIKSSTAPSTQTQRGASRLYEFSLDVLIKRASSLATADTNKPKSE